PGEPEMTMGHLLPRDSGRESAAARARLPRTAARLLPIAVALAAATPAAQGPALDPALLTRPPIAAWPTYHGDYSGRRYSTLKQITAGNVKNLGLAWVYRLNLGRGGAIVGGEGPDTPPPTGGPPAVKSTPLMLNGILYFSVPDHVYAVDARTGREVWHYAWKTRGGDHIGNRGVGIHGGWLYFLTPDNYFVSLDLATCKERWHHEIANMKREYFSTNAPMIIGRHVIIGVGGDALDIPGYLESRDPENGNLIWRWNTTPKPGEPDAATWPNEYAMSNGGGMPWLPGTFDPELNLNYLGTGNPNPVLTGRTREDDNLNTCSIVALNPDTGKMVWYYQVTPHDTHDWDATQTPVLIDGVRQIYSVMYLTDTDERPQGWSAAERNVGTVGTALKAIDYKTGKVRWSHPLTTGPAGGRGGAMGLLSTAGGVLFGNDGGGNFVAYDPATGRPLWHAGLGVNSSNGPQTFLVD